MQTRSNHTKTINELEESAESSIAKRLVDILRRLNNGEKLSPPQLATEYNVSLRINIQIFFLFN